jgi:hypothetical protein
MLSLHLSRKMYVGRDETQRFRLAEVQIRDVGDVSHTEKVMERLGVKLVTKRGVDPRRAPGIDLSHIHHQTGDLAV